jgi:hypothetical protein
LPDLLRRLANHERTEDLFGDGHLSSVIEAQRENLRNRIRGFQADYLFDVDEEELVQALIDEFNIARTSSRDTKRERLGFQIDIKDVLVNRIPRSLETLSRRQARPRQHPPPALRLLHYRGSPFPPAEFWDHSPLDTLPAFQSG